MAKKNTKKPKMSAAQREAKMKAAEERQKRAEAKKAAKERTKRIFTWVIVIILALGLSLPVAGLSATSCASSDAEQTVEEDVQNADAASADDADAASAAESSTGN